MNILTPVQFSTVPVTPKHYKPKSQTLDNAPNRLRELRVAKGHTLRFLAEYLQSLTGKKISCTAISNYERTGLGLGRRNVYRLCDLYKVDPRFMEGHIDTNPDVVADVKKISGNT